MQRMCEEPISLVSLLEALDYALSHMQVYLLEIECTDREHRIRSQTRVLDIKRIDAAEHQR
jgi:hypothetical protein